MGCWGSVPRHIDKNYIYGLPPSGELTPDLPSTPLHEAEAVQTKRSLEPLLECDSVLTSRQNSQVLQETLPKRRNRNGVSQSAKNAPRRVHSDSGASVGTSRSNSSSGRHSTSPAVVTGAAAEILSASIAGPPRQRTSQSVCVPETQDPSLGATRYVRKAFSTDESGGKGRRKQAGFMVGPDEPDPPTEEYSHREDSRLFHESKRERRHSHLRHKQANRNPRDAERNLRRRHHSRSSSSEEERERKKRDGDKSSKSKTKNAQKALLVPVAIVHGADESPGAERRCAGGGSSEEVFEEVGAAALDPGEQPTEYGVEEDDRMVVLNGAVQRGTDFEDFESDEERRRRETDMETSLILMQHEQLEEEEELKKKEEEEERLRREETEREQELLLRLREEDIERERERVSWKLGTNVLSISTVRAVVQKKFDLYVQHDSYDGSQSNFYDVSCTASEISTVRAGIVHGNSISMVQLCMDEELWILGLCRSPLLMKLE